METELWETPESTWTVIVREKDAKDRRTTRFLGEWKTEALARRALEDFLKSTVREQE